MDDSDSAPKPNGSGVDSEQKVFDTVIGPNLRWRDNLIQFAVVAGGLVLGAVVGAAVNQFYGNDPGLGALVGGFGGVVVSLLLSGAIIGLIRFILAMRPH